MKRWIPLQTEHQIKKIRQSDHAPPSAAVVTDENLLYEILKHVDARTLGTAACVSRWELICTRHLANIGCSNDHFRGVVLALGGFRCLHSHFLLPLTKPSVSVAAASSLSTVAAATASSSTWPCLTIPPRTVVPVKSAAVKSRWGKDEIQLSLSLLSIRYFEKLSYSNRKK